MSAWVTRYNPAWEQDTSYKGWVVPGPVSTEARCKLCEKNISLSNMGIQALISHSKSVKHINRMTSSKVPALTMTTFYKLKKKESIQSDGPAPALVQTNARVQETNITLLSENSKSTQQIDIPPHLTSDSFKQQQLTTPQIKQGTSLHVNANCTPSPQNVTKRATQVIPTETRLTSANTSASGLKSYCVSDSVINSEILWCINSVTTSMSNRAAASSVVLFSDMFPDSVIAKGLRLGKDKIGYSITFGLGPYFKHKVVLKLNSCEHLVLGFDESYNKVLKRNQLDIHMRFWDTELQQARSVYLTSQFLVRGTAKVLLEGITDGCPMSMLSKIIQISMDGPNVNYSVLTSLKELIANKTGLSHILDTGSCGLHIVHNAMKNGINATEWNLLKYFMSLHFYFTSLARFDDFKRISGSSLTPKKFCVIRWIENGDVCRRARELVPFLITYLKGAAAEKILPKNCNDLKVIKTFIDDPLCLAKLAFFQSLCIILEPLLTFFQSENPLAPLMWRKYSELLETLCSKIVKPGCLSLVKDITKLDVKNDEIYLGARDVELGFMVNSALAKKVVDKSILTFKLDCLNCIKFIIKHLLAKSPLKYPIFKGISCLDPIVAINPMVSKPLLNNALMIFKTAHLISDIEGEYICKEYEDAVKSDKSKLSFKSYSDNDRLDSLWLNVTDKLKHSNLIKFIKLALILSHGNLFLERGFSVNSDLLADNMSQKSLEAQRHVFQAASAMGGISRINIDNSMRIWYKKSNQEYKNFLKSRKEEERSEVDKATQKRQAKEQLAALAAKKQRNIEHATLENKLIDAEMEALRTKI